MCFLLCLKYFVHKSVICHLNQFCLEHKHILKSPWRSYLAHFIQMKIKEFNHHESRMIYMQCEDIWNSTGYGRKMRSSHPFGHLWVIHCIESHSSGVLNCSWALIFVLAPIFVIVILLILPASSFLCFFSPHLVLSSPGSPKANSVVPGKTKNTESLSSLFPDLSPWVKLVNISAKHSWAAWS